MLGATALRGVGLAVLLQTGVPGWLRAVDRCAHTCPAAGSRGSASVPADPDPPTASSRVDRPAIAMLSPTAYDEVAKLIASLVLSRHPPPGPSHASAHGGASTC
jgi:hypothetical protein